MPEKRIDCLSARRAIEAALGALQADDAGEPAFGGEHRGRDRVEVTLALAGGLCPALIADALDRGGQLARVGDRPRGEALEGAGGKRAASERQKDLPRRSGVRDAGPAESGDALDGLPALNEVDGDGVVLTGDGQRRGLARLSDEPFEVGAGQLAEVEPGEHDVPELEEA